MTIFGSHGGPHISNIGYLEVYGVIWRYTVVYGIWEYLGRVTGVRGRCAGGGRINAFRGLPSGRYENISSYLQGDKSILGHAMESDL